MAHGLFFLGRRGFRDSADATRPATARSPESCQRRRLQRRRSLPLVSSLPEDSVFAPITTGVVRAIGGKLELVPGATEKRTRFGFFKGPRTSEKALGIPHRRPYISGPVEVLTPATTLIPSCASQVSINQRKLGRQDEALGSHPPWENHLPHELDAPTLTANPKRWGGIFTLEQVMSAGRPASDEFGATPTVFSAEPVGGATEELVSEPQSLNEPVQLSEAEEDQEEDHTSTGSGSTPQILITGCDPNPPDTLGVSHAWRKEFMNERRTNRSLKRKHDKLEETLQTLWDAVRTYSTEDMSLDLPQRLELTVHFLVRDRIAAQIQLKDLQGYVDYWKEQADKDRRRLKATKAEVKRLKNLVRTAGPSPEATPLASGAGWYAMEVLSAP